MGSNTSKPYQLDIIRKAGFRVPETLITTDPATAVEIPPRVKEHLGLDEQRSWIVVNEGNRFPWPGFDLRKIPRTGEFQYGFLPPRFFADVLARFLKWYNDTLPFSQSARA